MMQAEYISYWWSKSFYKPSSHDKVIQSIDNAAKFAHKIQVNIRSEKVSSHNVSENYKKLLSELDKMLPYIHCFYARDSIVAAPKFGVVLQCLVQIFTQHTADICRTYSTNFRDETPEKNSKELSWYILREEIYNYLKQTSFLCWILLRSSALDLLTPHLQTIFINSLVTHLSTFFEPRASNSFSQKQSGTLSFTLAMLSCILQRNRNAAQIVSKHPKYNSVIRGVFALLSTKSKNGTKSSISLSSQFVYAFAFVCEVVAGTTVGASFFNTANVEYAMHIILSVIAAKPYTGRHIRSSFATPQCKLNKPSIENKDSTGKENEAIELELSKKSVASLIQRVCVGVTEQLASKSNPRVMMIVERCLAKQSIRRLLARITCQNTKMEDINNSHMRKPVRTIGLDGNFGTPSRLRQSGMMNALESSHDITDSKPLCPHYMHPNISCTFLSLSACRFEFLCSLLISSQSAIICSIILVIGGEAFLRWILAMISLAPPPSFFRSIKSKQKGTSNYEKKDWTVVKISELQPWTALRATFYIDCFVTASKLIQSFVSLNASAALWDALLKGRLNMDGNRKKLKYKTDDVKIASLISRNFAALFESQQHSGDQRSFKSSLKSAESLLDGGMALISSCNVDIVLCCLNSRNEVNLLELSFVLIRLDSIHCYVNFVTHIG